MFTLAEQTAALSELSHSLAPPFDNPEILGTVYVLAEQISPSAASYSRLVGEGMGSGLVLPIYEGVISRERKRRGHSDVVTSVVDDEKVSMLTLAGMPTAEDGRTLVLTEVTKTGDSLRALYQKLGEFLSASTIDIATVGVLEDNVDSSWLDPESEFYLTPSWFSKSAGFLLHVKSKYQWSGSKQMQEAYRQIDKTFARLLAQ